MQREFHRRKCSFRQGLGTGLLFTDNIDYPLHIEGDCLWFHPEEQEPDLLNWLKQ